MSSEPVSAGRRPRVSRPPQGTRTCSTIGGVERFERIWSDLDPEGPPRLVWLRAPAEETALLLGAFDPPTNAHLALARHGARAAGTSGGFCLTRELLDRDGHQLLPAPQRLRLLDALATDEGLALAVANRGTYRSVAQALLAEGRRPTFLIGSDKLPQLEDPSFHPDGRAGVDETFALARFLVVLRGVPVGRDDVEVLDPDAVFGGGPAGTVSATAVRERLRKGRSVDDLVPPLVAAVLAGYTEPSDRG